MIAKPLQLYLEAEYRSPTERRAAGVFDGEYVLLVALAIAEEVWMGGSQLIVDEGFLLALYLRRTRHCSAPAGASRSWLEPAFATATRPRAGLIAGYTSPEPS